MRRFSAPVLVGLLTLGTCLAASAAPRTLTSAPKTWTVVRTPAMSSDTSQGLLNQITSVAPGALFAAGYTRHNLPGTSEVRALVEHWTGSAWQVMDTPDVETAPAADYLYGISGSSATDVWAVGQSATASGRSTSKPLAMHWNGSAWSIANVPDPSGGSGAGMSAIVSLGPGNAWAVGTAYPLEAAGAVYRLDGAAWSSYRLPLLPGCTNSNYTELLAITATPNGDVYAGGDCPAPRGRIGFVVKMITPTQWQVVLRMPATSNIADLAAAADGSVWATGSLNNGTINRAFVVHGSGTTWKHIVRAAPADQNTEVPSGVAVTPSGATVVGEIDSRTGQRAPFIATFRNGHWTTAAVTPAPTDTEWLTAVTGSENGDVWATGHYLGNRADIVPITAHP